MAKTLIIVESPTKAKTISTYLSNDYTIKASMGHVRDLPKSQLGIELSTFEPHYVTIGRANILKDLRSAAQGAERILLATDPDREGEAIAWHIAHLLHIHHPQRLEFHEVTRKAIQEALAHPQPLNQSLVEAQQARRILDRLVGYTLSPLLWRKVQRGISAGRVQSVVLRLVCEREREIQSFEPQEYWTLDVWLSQLTHNDPFLAAVIEVDGKKPDLRTVGDAQALTTRLRQSAFAVQDITKRPIQRRPAPPFTTSTLQQAASNRLGMSAKRTMAIAQELYEGIALGTEGQQGLITYMRTDSVNIAGSAIEAVRSYIQGHFAPGYLPPRPNRYETKTRGAQEAHEAIRPTDPARTPETIRGYLTQEQFRLYELIWQRFIACQMTSAEYLRTSVDIIATADQQRARLRASAQQLVFPGYLTVYGVNAEEQAQERAPDSEDSRNSRLPELTLGEKLQLIDIKPDQHFTEPPPRYNEASLVRKLEEEGIGRPSTYAQIISTIQERDYVQRQGRALIPTPLGFATNDFLVEHFDSVVDLQFTAKLEEQLDDIAAGGRKWRDILQDFYGPFSANVEAKQNVPHVHIERPPAVETGEACPQCGRPLVERRSRFGTFIGCSGYPECKFIKKSEQQQQHAPAEPTGITCPRCGKGHLVKRTATRGRNQGNTFYGCSNYPKCRFITNSLENLNADKEQAVQQGNPGELNNHPLSNGQENHAVEDEQPAGRARRRRSTLAAPAQGQHQ